MSSTKFPPLRIDSGVASGAREKMELINRVKIGEIINYRSCLIFCSAISWNIWQAKRTHT